MTGETVPNSTKTFKFSFPTCTNEEVLFKLEVPIQIPYEGSTRELVQRVLKMFHIPVYLEDELNSKLSEFVSKETKCFEDKRDENLINQFKNNEINVDAVIKNWEKLFKDNVVEFAEQKGSSDEEVFATAYHKLVHSPALETILQVENSYARTVTDTLKNRDEDIRKITHRQTEEMEDMLRRLNSGTTEEDINSLAGRHFEEQAIVVGRWGSQLDALRQTQRSQHRAWLMRTLEEYHTCAPLHTPSNSPLATFLPELPPAEEVPHEPRLEESFTIHLGSQLKTTHNMRIFTSDLDELFPIYTGNNPSASRRPETALNLYSSSLSACVVVCGVGAGGEVEEAVKRAAAATDHHFPALDTQLENIMKAVKEPAEQRNAERAAERGTAERGAARARQPLQAGDVFVTRHSNMSELHVVFHIVGDDASLRTGEMTSRHPCILALRNVMKACFLNDVACVTLPLLLRHELHEDMTAAWCLRRAELVLKCVKGFMLEWGPWQGGARTVAALVPRAAAPVFPALAALLGAVFRPAPPRHLTPHSAH